MMSPEGDKAVASASATPMSGDASSFVQGRTRLFLFFAWDRREQLNCLEDG